MKKGKFYGVIFLLGILAKLLRGLLYRGNLDSRGLIPAGSFLDAALWVLTAGALVLCFLAENRKVAAKNWSIAGNAFFAFGLLFSTQDLTQGYSVLLLLCSGLSITAALALAAEAVQKFRGKKLPYVWILVCLSLIVRLIAAYQTWSREPQMQDFLLPLLAGLAGAAFAYRRAAERVGLPRSPWTYRLGLAAMYLCIAASGSSQTLLFYSMTGVGCFFLSGREEGVC